MHLMPHPRAGSAFSLASVPAVTLVLALLVLAAPTASAQDATAPPGQIDVDFLFNYYQQDGDHSPVTGGIGTEDMDVLSPVILVSWKVDENWTLRTDLGLDAITSASVDAMDADVSSASRQDSRAYVTLTGSRALGESSTLTLLGGFSNEYDYRSLMAGAGWSRDFNRRNTNLSAQARLYSDTVELYDIDSVLRGEDDRESFDLTVGLTQVLSAKTLLSLELFGQQQDGYLATPFHEVILDDGRRVGERLPDSRQRTAFALGLNHAVNDRLVPRLRYRFYDDDWGIQAHSVEFEPHFRVAGGSGGGSSWIYPILRWHTQTGSDYFGLPGAFAGDEPFITADRDLSELTSEKYGLGWHWSRAPGTGRGWARRLRRLQTRATYYTRDDGLESLSVSFGFGWSF